MLSLLLLLCGVGGLQLVDFAPVYRGPEPAEGVLRDVTCRIELAGGLLLQVAESTVRKQSFKCYLTTRWRAEGCS